MTNQEKTYEVYFTSSYAVNNPEIHFAFYYATLEDVKAQVELLNEYTLMGHDYDYRLIDAPTDDPIWLEIKKKGYGKLWEIMIKKEFIDWNGFLNRDVTSYTVQELERAVQLSQAWITCACGNLCNALPKYSTGEPKDYQLSDLGSEFHDMIARLFFVVQNDTTADFIQNREFAQNEAKNTLNCIELRTAYLLKKN